MCPVNKLRYTQFPQNALFLKLVLFSWRPRRAAVLQGLICGTEQPSIIYLVAFFSHIFSGVDGFSVDVTTMVDIRDQTNKELAMRLVTDIQSGDVFYSDLNGFQVGPTE